MDLTFSTLDPEATDSPMIILQKRGVVWRAIQAASSGFSGGGGGGGNRVQIDGSGNVIIDGSGNVEID